jgi:hypothetical protein
MTPSPRTARLLLAVLLFVRLLLTATGIASADAPPWELIGIDPIHEPRCQDKFGAVELHIVAGHIYAITPELLSLTCRTYGRLWLVNEVRHDRLSIILREAESYTFLIRLRLPDGSILDDTSDLPMMCRLYDGWGAYLSIGSGTWTDGVDLQYVTTVEPHDYAISCQYYRLAWSETEIAIIEDHDHLNLPMSITLTERVPAKSITYFPNIVNIQ